jgi:L-threonylcarbamoyladenylate synthase
VKHVPVDTTVLPTHTMALMDDAVLRAAELLRGGQVVAVPTETVYGLAANAFDKTAVGRIFEIKGRPATNPLIVHVNSVELARQCTVDWPATAQKLADAFWPGPLTIVLPRSTRIPGIVTANGLTVAIRWPRHPFVRKLVDACGFPLAAPSANVSGETSPTTAAHVLKSLGGKLLLIVDGGTSNIGIESTVLDLTVQPARILRPGMISAESLAAVTTGQIGEDSFHASPGVDGPARSPGMLERHYAPKAPLIVLSWTDDADLSRQLTGLGVDAATTHIISHTRIPGTSGFGQPPSRFQHVVVVPNEPEAFARALYAELHRADELGAGAIVAEAVPDEAPWRGIADRLRRASVRK